MVRESESRAGRHRHDVSDGVGDGLLDVMVVHTLGVAIHAMSMSMCIMRSNIATSVDYSLHSGRDVLDGVASEMAIVEVDQVPH